MIDGAILQKWLGKKGHGRKLMNTLMKVYFKALEEEASQGGKEITAYIAHLAIMNFINSTKNRLKKIVMKGVSYESLDYALGVTLYFLLEAGIWKVFEAFRESHPIYKLDETKYILRSTLSACSFLSIKDPVTRDYINPYNLSKTVVTGFMSLSVDFDQFTNDPENTVESIIKETKQNEALTHALINRYKFNRLRYGLFNFISRYSDRSGDGYTDLLKALRDERIIVRIISDEKYGKEWRSKLGGLRSRLQKQGDKVELLNILERCLSFTKQGRLSGIMKREEKIDKNEAFKDAALAFISYRFDKEVEQYLTHRKPMLVDRVQDISLEGALSEYEKGRAYLFSADKRPLLKKLGLASEGQLFIDMKDFTRSTFKVKEITMADFMKDQFYKPILDAASKYAVGGMMMDDSQSIQLENLLGDAVIFSGNITSLVFLALDIQSIMDKYRQYLEEKIQSLKIENLLDEVKKNYAALKEEILEEKKMLEKVVKSGKEGINRWIEVLDREEDLEKAFRHEVSESAKKEVEAGLFISYGATAEKINLESEQWGKRNVAIGEKINEAARGTSRNALVSNKITKLLHNAKEDLKLPNLKLPFDVYIDRVYNIKVDLESASSINKAIIERKAPDAEKIVKRMAPKLFKDLKEILQKGSLGSSAYLSKTRDIYNNGDALSEKALNAFLEESKNYIRHFQKKVNISELHPNIRERFFFTEDILELWFSIKEVENKVMIFRKVGRLVFKGFELGGTTSVYEILKTNSDFYKMILEHHFNAWLEDLTPH